MEAVFIRNFGATYSGQDRCLSEATAWIEKIASFKGSAVEENDPRFKDFVELKR